jgi:hypothetical protein
VWSDGCRTEPFQQSFRQITSSEGHRIQTLKGIFKLHLNTKFGGDISRVDHPIITTSETMRQHTWISEPRSQGFAWQTRQATQCGYAKPTKSVDHLIAAHRLPQCPKVEPEEKRDGVDNHVGLTNLSCCRSPSSGKRSVCDTYQSLATTTNTGQGIKLIGNPGRQFLLATVETNGTGNRHEQKTW